MRISDGSSDVCSSDLAGVQGVVQPGLLHRGLEGALGLVPGGVVAGAHGGAVGELHHQILEAEVPVDLAEQVAEDHRLAAELVRSEESREGNECVSTCRTRGST